MKPFQAEVPAGSGAAPGRDWTRIQPGRLVQRLDQGTVRAVGLALAAMVANLVAVLFTVAFTRLLGADEYGDLAALLNVTITLFVPGYALQVAVARAGTAGRMGGPGELSATLARWTRQLTVALVAVAALSVLLREQLAAALNLSETWAVAAVPAAAAGWLLLCLQRGLLQAAQAYRAVGVSIVIENVARLLVALMLVATGAGVTGAYLGTVIAVGGSAAVLSAVLRRRLGPRSALTAAHSLRELTRDAAVSIGALTLLAALQNADVVMAKHALSATAAGVYAAATVAGKATVWVAIGLGLWVLPEATRQAAEGRDPRPVLDKALLVVGVVAGVALTAYGAAPRLVLRLAFGPGYETGAPIPFMLGVAYALLAVSYLAGQYLLGLHRRRFTFVLAAAAAALPMWLSGYDAVTGFALVVLVVQTASAGALVLIRLSTRYGREARTPHRPHWVATPTAAAEA